MFRNLRLGQKMIASYIFMAVLVCATGGAGLFYVNEVGADGLDLGEFFAPHTDAAMEIIISSANAHILFEEITAGETEHSIDQVWDHMREALWFCDAILHGAQGEAGVFRAATDPEVRSKIETVKKNAQEFMDVARAKYAAHTSDDKNVEVMVGRFDAAYDALTESAHEVEVVVGARMSDAAADLRRHLDDTERAMTIAMMLAAFVAIVLGMLLSRSFSLPIVAAADLSTRIAQGDLTQQGSGQEADDRGDEIGSLSRAFTSMRTNLRDVMERLQAGIVDLSGRSSQVGSTAKQYATSAAEQASAVTETSTTIEEIKQTSEAAAQSAQEVVQAAESAVQTGNRGLEAIATAVQATAVVGERVREISRQIVHLSEQNAQIGEIVETVTELAEQSNLLAVNASIEAAQAGEQGRRFAVVASEVRSLAEQSKRAATQIRGILDEIQKATDNAVATSSEGTKRAEEGRTSIDSVRLVVEELAAVLESSADQARRIAGAATQQASGVAQISQAVGNVDSAARDNLNGVTQLEEAATGLSTLGTQMKEIVARYSV